MDVPFREAAKKDLLYLKGKVLILILMDVPFRDVVADIEQFEETTVLILILMDVPFRDNLIKSINPDLNES